MGTRQRCRRHVLTVTAGLLAATAIVAPAGADEHGGTVTGTVTVADAAEACLLVEATDVDFGVLDFGESRFAPVALYTVASCSDSIQDLYVAGSDAAGGEGAAWSLSASWPATNQYRLHSSLLLEDGWASRLLTTTPQLLTQLDADESGEADHLLLMPTAGSDGAGQVMTFDMVWTAVLAE